MQASRCSCSLVPSDTWKFFSGNGAGCQDPKRIPPPGALASWALGQLRAQVVTLQTITVKKVNKPQLGLSPHSSEATFMPGLSGSLPELCCCCATVLSAPVLVSGALVSWTPTCPGLGPLGPYSHSRWSGPLASLSGCCRMGSHLLRALRCCSEAGNQRVPPTLAPWEAWLQASPRPYSPAHNPMGIHSSAAVFHHCIYPIPGCKWRSA